MEPQLLVSVYHLNYHSKKACHLSILAKSFGLVGARCKSEVILLDVAPF